MKGYLRVCVLVEILYVELMVEKLNDVMVLVFEYIFEELLMKIFEMLVLFRWLVVMML